MPGKRKVSIDAKRKADTKRKALQRQCETLEAREARLAQMRERQNINCEMETEAVREARLAEMRERQNTIREMETEAVREARLAEMRERQNTIREMETEAVREARLAEMRERQNINCEMETEAVREARLSEMRERQNTIHEMETEEVREARLAEMRERENNTRAIETGEDREVRLTNKRQSKDYNLGRKQHFDESVVPQSFKIHSCGSFRNTKYTCAHCKAFRWKDEKKSICCCNGTVMLDPLPDPPESMKTFCDVTLHRSKFLANTRVYNSALALASIGCHEIKQHGFSPTFTVHGKLYHRIGSLLPDDNETPKFAQLYFYDTDNEITNRLSIMDGLNPDILRALQNVMHGNNEYIKLFKSSLEIMSENANVSLVLHADKKSRPAGQHARTYNLPTASEIGALIPGGETADNLDVIIHGRNGKLTRINPVHRAYDPLHYVVMFPHGSDGFQLGLKKTNGQTLTALNFYSYRLQERQEDFNIIMKVRKLTQQYACDMFCKIEGSRLKWIKDHQNTIRAEKYSGLFDAHTQGDLVNAGTRIILPPTVYGSPRFYSECFQNAMAIVRTLGKPDLFITFTCSPRWPEIVDALNPGEQYFDRPDLACRVFKMKYDALMDDLLKKNVLGKVKAHTATIEFQKRGLPHVHILLILEDDDKPRTPEKVDTVVCAEIPDVVKNPQLYRIITTHNIHGPCGNINTSSPCMDGVGSERRCLKNFPKTFRKNTILPEQSYPEYRRRSKEEGGRTHMMKLKGGHDFTVDNSFVVPYNPLLSLKYNAHINVEVVFTTHCVKYLYKYITKGQDKVIMQLAVDENDEVERYINARYISASEAYWRIYSFELHRKAPAVIKLQCHLPDQQIVVFQDENDAAEALENGPPVTKLIAYFRANVDDPEANNILYPDFPRYFTWDQKHKKWQRRKRGRKTGDDNLLHVQSQAIGRVPTVSLSPHQAELFYLRMLLYNKSGAKSFEDLRTVDGEVCETFQDACCRMGLLESDDEQDKVMEEAASIRFGDQLRNVFATLLIYCRPANPLEFWERHKTSLCQDLMRAEKLAEPTDAIVNRVLIFLQDRMDQDGLNLNKDFGLPNPTMETVFDELNIPSVIREETSYDTKSLALTIPDRVASLTDQQRNVYDAVINSITAGDGKLFALKASAGTGKTYTLNLILDTIRSQGKIALGTAMSGIAATLLHNGRTLHSRCKVPINITETSSCNISPNDATAKLIKEASVLIIDEVGMGHKHVFEAIDRTFQDIRNNKELFGGLTVVFAADWRQGLPIVRRGSRSQVVDACVKKSYIWSAVKVFTLQKNMRVLQKGDDEEFGSYLNKCGDGQLPIDKDLGEFKTKVPDDLLFTGKLDDLCSWVFEDLLKNHTDGAWLCQRAIICPTNKILDSTNYKMMEQFPGAGRFHKSCDSISENSHQYPAEFLNSLVPSGMPPHKLLLKEKAPIMLLRNMDQSSGHCNGTKYVVTKLHQHVIEATIATGDFAGNRLFIPRIPLIPSENTFPFSLRRVQFPIRPCFCITSDKSQGQTLQKVGVYLDKPFFSHGRKYVAESRVGEKKALKILVENGTYENKEGVYTDNVVYSEIL